MSSVHTVYKCTHKVDFSFMCKYVTHQKLAKIFMCFVHQKNQNRINVQIPCASVFPILILSANPMCKRFPDFDFMCKSHVYFPCAYVLT